MSGRLRHLNFRQKFLYGLFVLIFAPGVFILAYAFIYEPIKFHYLIWRVESARTPEEEREAFALANQWGHVFEWTWLRHDQLPEEARHILGNRVLRFEWLESASWNGHAYHAYRVVLDEANMQILTRSN